MRRSQSATTKEIGIKTFRNLFTNPWFISAIVLYLISLLVLSQRAEFSISDAMMELVIFGIAFPLLAWWASRRAEHLPINVHPTGGEMLAVVAYVLALSVYLAFGPQAIDSWLPQNWIASDRIRFFITLSKKLLVFVALPLAIFGPIWGYSARDFGFQKAGLRELRRTHLSVVLVGSGVLMAFNYFLGGAAAPLREGKFSGSQLLIGLPLCFIWLTIEAGLVEEFFFRAFLQTRLSAWFRSEVTGVVLMALIFGLAHAPGFVFRHAGAVEGLGANPSGLDAIAYSIVTLAVSGVFFGVIWARTRNLFALMLIHAAADLFPNLSDFVKTWGL
jgi:membrane protease YdiL (CAAX protease family)